MLAQRIIDSTRVALPQGQPLWHLKSLPVSASALGITVPRAEREQLKHDLRRYSIYPVKSLNTKVLRLLLSHAVKGMFAYPKYTRPELALFCCQRHEDIPDTERRASGEQYVGLCKMGLMKVLQAADAAMEFEHFSGLSSSLEALSIDCSHRSGPLLATRASKPWQRRAIYRYYEGQ